MEKVIIDTSGIKSEIIISSGWKKILPALPSEGTVIITDTNVRRIYGSTFPDYPVLEIKPGEQSKSLKEVEKLSQRLLDEGIGRTGFILAIGGGVVSDIAGFLASVFMRGIGCGYISTSLLSQVDASTGGKNGVNLGNIKNVIGSFRQPEFVICDISMLHTLTEEEYLSGLAELIKTGFIGDPEIIDLLEDNYDRVIERKNDILSILVSKAIKYKASIVSHDEKESGVRRILNFGHTFGHALELHESLKHGFAVASGMELATGFSIRMGYLKSEEASRLTGLLNKYRLLKEYNVSARVMEKLLMHDKKRKGSDIYCVFIEKTGSGIVRKVPVSEVIDFYRTHNK